MELIITLLNSTTVFTFWAVNWVMANVEGVETDEGIAIRIPENMREKNIICHASGNTNQPFFQGFYFYYMHPSSKVCLYTYLLILTLFHLKYR